MLTNSLASAGIARHEAGSKHRKFQTKPHGSAQANTRQHCLCGIPASAPLTHPTVRSWPRRRRRPRDSAAVIIGRCTSASPGYVSIARRYMTPTVARSAHQKPSDSSRGGSPSIQRRGTSPRRTSVQMPRGSTATAKSSTRNSGDPERRDGFAAVAS